MSITFTDHAVQQLRTAINDQRGQVEGMRAGDPLFDSDYPQVYFIRIPAGGIPGRTGLQLGQAQCELFLAPKTAPISSEARSLTPVLLPNGIRRQITVSNLDTAAIPGAPFGANDADSLYAPTWQHIDGTWFTVAVEQHPTSSSSGPSSLSSHSACGGPVTFYETTTLCESGKLNIYRRPMDLSLVNGCLTLVPGTWVFAYAAGCCTCHDCTGDCTWIAVDDSSSSSSGSLSSTSSPSSPSSTTPSSDSPSSPSSSAPSSSTTPSSPSSAAPSSSTTPSSDSPTSSTTPSSSQEPSSIAPSSVSSNASLTACPQGFCTFTWSVSGAAWVQQSGTCSNPSNDPGCRCRTPAELYAYLLATTGQGSGHYDGEMVFDYCYY